MEYNEYIYNILRYLKDLKIDRYRASNVFIRQLEKNIIESGILKIVQPKNKEQIIELVETIKKSYEVCDTHKEIEDHYKDIYTLVKIEIKEKCILPKEERSGWCIVL
jgi:hypothetical protein